MPLDSDAIRAAQDILHTTDSETEVIAAIPTPEVITPIVPNARDLIVEELDKGFNDLKTSGTPMASTYDVPTSDSGVNPYVTKAGKKKTKPELDADILLLENELGLENRSVKKLKKDETMKYLAELMEKAGRKISESNLGLNLEKSKSTLESTIKSDIKAHNTPPPNAAPILTTTEGAELIHRTNCMFAYVLEQVSMLTKDKTGCSLEGYSKQVNSDKERLRGIYERLYKEHGKEICQYMTPLSELLLYHLAVAGPVLAENKKKNGGKQQLRMPPTQSPVP